MNKIFALGVLLVGTPLIAQAADMPSTGHAHVSSMETSTLDHSVSKNIKQDTANMTPASSTQMTGMSSMDHSSMDMPDMDHSSMNHGLMDMPDMDHSSMGHGSSNMASMDHGSMDHSSMNMDDMDHSSMKMDKMQGGKAPADARDPDYSQGRDYGDKAPPEMMGNGVFTAVVFNQLELSRADGKNTGNYDFDGWLGTDWNRIALKAEGDIANSKLEDARTELLWRKPIGIFWNSELGVRQDSGYEKNRSWLALGIKGISPYWVDLDATVYLGKDNRTAFRGEATYDWRILQRLILQPSIEANLYGKTDSENNIGKGLSDIQAGLRLRYELTRQFAPYIGVETTRQFGKTADLLKLAGERTQRTAAVAGVRFWF